MLNAIESRYCTCGASLVPPTTVAALVTWRRTHAGLGHEKCDAETATQARCRARRATARAEQREAATR